MVEMKRIQVRIGKLDEERLEKQAKERGITPSEAARELLSEKLRELEAGATPTQIVSPTATKTITERDGNE